MFCFPKSRINENGGNSVFACEPRRSRSWEWCIQRYGAMQMRLILKFCSLVSISLRHTRSFQVVILWYRIIFANFWLHEYTRWTPAEQYTKILNSTWTKSVEFVASLWWPSFRSRCAIIDTSMSDHLTSVLRSNRKVPTILDYMPLLGKGARLDFRRSLGSDRVPRAHFPKPHFHGGGTWTGLGRAVGMSVGELNINNHAPESRLQVCCFYL